MNREIKKEIEVTKATVLMRSYSIIQKTYHDAINRFKSSEDINEIQMRLVDMLSALDTRNLIGFKIMSIRTKEESLITAVNKDCVFITNKNTFNDPLPLTKLLAFYELRFPEELVAALRQELISPEITVSDK